MCRPLCLGVLALASVSMTFAAERPPRARGATGAAQPNGNLFPQGFVPPNNANQQNRNLSTQDAAGIILRGLNGSNNQQPNNPNYPRPNGPNNPPKFDFVPPSSITNPPQRPNTIRPNNFIPSQPQNIRPQPQYIPQQPQYVPQPPTVINNRPNVIPNTPPPIVNNTVPEPQPEAEPLVDNPPAIEPSGLNLLSGEDYTSMREALDESVAASVEELGTLASKIGVADNEGVKEAQAAIQAQIDNGEPVSDEAIEAYEEAVKKAVMDKADTLSDEDSKQLTKSLEKLQTESEIAVLFDTDFPADPFDPILPSGDLDLAVIPGLPPGQILYLPGGCLITGTEPGGEMAFIETTTAELLNVPVGSGNVPQGNLWAIRKGVLIVNPEANGAAVNFQFDGQNYALAAGEWQHLEPKSRREIQFDPGNGGASVRYSLADGTYVFSGEGGSWQLANRKFNLVMEGEGHTAPFHYQASGEPTEIAPGSTREHSGDYPIVISFNRGRDGENADRSFYEADVKATIALDPADNMWDLFLSEQVQAPPPPASPKGVFDRTALKSRKKEGAADASAEKGTDAKKSAFNLAKFRKALKPM